MLKLAESTALECSQRIDDEPDRALVLRDTIVGTLGLLCEQTTDENRRAVLDVLLKIVPMSVDPLYTVRQLLQTDASRANPLLKAMLSTLTTLAELQEPVASSVLTDVVTLVHLVCRTSMTTADVVLLFEFLRVSCSPVRHLVLQMQMALLEGETMPRAVFTMHGVHAGIIAPSTQLVFSKKGYSLSFGLLLGGAGASVVSLYSFRGSTGQGVSAVIEGSNLVVKMHGANGSTSQVSIPFSPWRTKMEKEWVHLCVVHSKKMVFKDKIAVYADGASIFNGNLSYPDPLAMVGGQNCIGVIPAVAASFQGRMWSPTLFGQPLSDTDVQKLHWLTHWKSDLGSVAAENTGLSDKSKVIFSYDARSCDPEKRVCLDVSGNECHGWMEPGTKSFVTQGLRQAMDSVGGSACFLLLLLDQIPELADFHPKQELTQDEISDLMAFVAIGMRSSVACRAHFLRLRGVNVLAFVLQSVSPQYLTQSVLDSVTGILASILDSVASPEDELESIDLLLFRNANWFLSPFETQVKLLAEVFPLYLKTRDELLLSQCHSQKAPGMAAATSAMEALGIVAASSSSALDPTSSSSRAIDVSFFCNLLVQVYSPRLASNDEGADGRKTKAQLETLRRLIIEKLLDRLLCPLVMTDGMYHWRQLFTHLHRRCAKISVEAFAQDGEGIEVHELLEYLRKILASDSSTVQHQRQTATTKLCKLSHGTLRLWWHAMRSPVPDIRLSALRLFETYCTDKVTMKRRDAAMLLTSCQGYPIDIGVAQVLLDLIIGRKHTSYYGTASSSAPPTGPNISSGRSTNVARLEFMPTVLLHLLVNADTRVQAHILYEVKMLAASPNFGQVAVEAIRSWPPWLSRLDGLIHGAQSTVPTVSSTPATCGLSPQALNDVCAVLSDENSAVAAKIDAIHAIGSSGDLAGCDFMMSVFQNADLPASVIKAIATAIQDHFPSRCGALAAKIAKQIIVDVLVYSVLHVRNGWLHFLEFVFYSSRRASDLCSMTASVVERVIRRLTPRNNQHAGPSSNEASDFMWENLSQVASIVSITPVLVDKLQPLNPTRLSQGQRRILCRKAYDLWLLVLLRLHWINWEELKTQLLQNANFCDAMAAEDKEIFCHLVAGSAHARFLALETVLSNLRFAQEASEFHLGHAVSLKKTLEQLRLIPPDAQRQSISGPPPHRSFGGSASPPSLSISPASVADALASYTSDSAIFFGEARCKEAQVPRELVHLHVLDTLFETLVHQLEHGRSDEQSFRAAQSLVEIIVALALSVLRLHDASSESNATVAAEVVKSLQIITSTDPTFFLNVGQLQQLLALWKLHRDLHETFCNENTLENESNHLNQPFLRRWTRLFQSASADYNPYLIQKDASLQAELAAQEMSACETLWRALLDDAAEADASFVDSTERGLPSLLKQDAEKFASSVHKLILHSCRSSRASAADTESISKDLTTTGDAPTVLWKVDSRENAYRMRLRLKQVRDNYRLRNLSYEYTENPLHTDENGRRSGSFQLGPRRFQSARDNIRALSAEGAEYEKTWRSEAGSDYSDFLADAQMRAAIIRSCPSVSSDRDSFNGDFSADEVDDDDDDELQGEGQSDGPEEVFEREVGTITAAEQPTTVQQPPPSAPMEVPPPPPSPPVSSTTSTKSSSPSSPLGAFSGFGASLLNVVGDVTDMVTKAAKDAKDAMELGVDSLYTARDVLSDDAQALVQDVNASLAETRPKPSVSESRSPALTGDCKRLTVKISHESPATSASPHKDSGPILFPLSPPLHKQAKKNTTTLATVETLTLTRKNSFGSSRDVEFDANLMRHMHVVAGKLFLTETHLWFLAEQVIDEHETVLAERKKGVPIAAAWHFLFKRRRWKIDDLTSVNRRRYLLKPAALEISIASSRKNYFFSLKMDDIGRFHEALMTRRPAILRRDPSMRRLRHPSSIFRNSNMSVRWMNHEVSTFEYLMWLNTIAGRTYNDLTQYPVFPWVIADYESPTLDLTRACTFRDLSKPMGALDPSRLKFFIDRYNTFEDSDIPKFMYGTHYSNIGVVLYYLIRLEPFTTYGLSIQGGKFDHADRLFHSVAETWNNCLHDFNDVKELTPEWFYQPEFLKNCNQLDMGCKQSGVALGDVVLPPWASSPEDFVLKNFMALECEYVSMHIHTWIDLIFGATQRGQAAVDANNVFFYLTYEGMVDVDSITDPVTKSSMRAQIAHFGQTPTQVLRDPHPPRLTVVNRARRASIGPTEPPPLSLSGPTTLKHPSSPVARVGDSRWTTLVVPHDSPIALLHLVPGTTSMLCVDTNGQLSMQRYSTKSVKVHHTPFLNDISSTATKASGVFKHPHANSSPLLGPTTAPTSPGASEVSTSTEYMELHDRKSRKIIGDKRLLMQNDYAPQVRVAFVNGGAVYCSVGHHDFSARFHSSTDGALLYRLLQHHAVVNCVGSSSNGALLALGSSDGTISVWKVAHIASTLLDSIKLFRGSKSPSRPVHASDYSADQVLLGHASVVNCVAVSDDLGICVSGSVSNECLVHDLSDGSILHQLVVPGSDAPGVVSIALSPLGLIMVQSMGLGTPWLYTFHLNGSLLASTALIGDKPMASLSVCSRYCKVILSSRDAAIMYSMHSLADKEVLLDKTEHGEIACHSLSPDETHIVFSVGSSGKLIARSLVPHSSVATT